MESSPSAEALRAVALDPEYTLVITSPQATWAAGETIEVGASLNYLGGAPAVTLTGSGSGVIGFSVEEMNGNRRMEAAWHDDCRRYTIGPREPITSPYRKSGAFDAEEPNAPFYEAYFADPLFRLPNGAWKVTAIASFNTSPECGGDRTVLLQASVVISVQ